MKISERLFAILKDKGLSYADLSKGTGISANTIGDWARKGTNPSAEKISSICKYLGVSCYYFLTGTDPMPALTRNEREILELLRQLPDERTQIKFIARAEALAQEMQGKPCFSSHKQL